MRILEGKVAIVTGAARGLGRAFALRLLGEGARVVGVDVNEEGLAGLEKEMKEKGGEGFVITGDVSIPRDARIAADETYKRYSRIDILVNNAGIIPSRKPFYEIPSEEFDRIMDVNVKGVWLCTCAVFPYMAKQKSGKIINLASEVFFTGSKLAAHYVASKGGVIGLTRALANELGSYNICVNAIAPGFTVTEGASVLGDFSSYDVSQTPLGRIELPEDLFGALIFFASEASDFVTGQVLLVDGGRVKH